MAARHADQLSQHGFRLITFLLGQPQLMKQRADYQNRGEEQIVARFMIEHMRFRGVASAQDAATYLASYDLPHYPQDGGPTFTGYFYPQATACGLKLESQAGRVWNAFVQAHAAAQLSGPVESRWTTSRAPWKRSCCKGLNGMPGSGAVSGAMGACRQ